MSFLSGLYTLMFPNVPVTNPVSSSFFPYSTTSSRSLRSSIGIPPRIVFRICILAKRPEAVNFLPAADETF